MARDQADLTALDDANNAVLSSWRAAMKSIATTPATTAAGLAVKLRLLVEGLEMGESDYDREIARGALKDAERLDLPAAADPLVTLRAKWDAIR